VAIVITLALLDGTWPLGSGSGLSPLQDEMQAGAQSACKALCRLEHVPANPEPVSERRIGVSATPIGGTEMDWNRIEGNWKQFAGKVKTKWGKLTDDDLTMVNGSREQLEGKIQQRYGQARDQIRKDVDDWLKSMP
jgi:uncharacterized protein YjbJ (UPF0337 family)